MGVAGGAGDADGACACVAAGVAATPNAALYVRAASMKSL